MRKLETSISGIQESPGRPLKMLLFLWTCLLTVSCGVSSPDEIDPPVAYIAGETHFGRNSYIEYIVGDLPVIISAPHGGSREPVEIPDRTWGTTVRDSNTRELAREISSALQQLTGRQPHLVICNLRRTKLDANRSLEEAAQGNQYATLAWNEFHGFIEIASDTVTAKYGSGLYIDLHGHGHDNQRLELGYLISGTLLDQSDEVLDQIRYVEDSSIRGLVGETGTSLSDLIRGPFSLGSLFEEGGYPAVPSTAQPGPDGEAYYSGGYNTRRHGSSDGGTISGVQIECNWSGVRDSEEARLAFSTIVAEVLEEYLRKHFGLEIGSGQVQPPILPR